MRDRKLKMLKPAIKQCLFILASMLLWGCQDLSPEKTHNPQTTPIKSLNRFPAQRKLKPILLQGKVVRQAPFLQGGAYLLQDKTGQIWVVTERMLPQTGADILLQGGQESKQIAIGKRKAREVYVQELERLSSQAPNQN